MITIIGIDPGPVLSAYVAMSGRRLERFGKIENAAMIDQLDFTRLESDPTTTLAIEMVSSYGMPVGEEIFETCVWIGRFIQRWGGRFVKVKRGEIKMHLCGSPHAKDPNIRAALIEKYGGKDAAIGKKGAYGPLHGVTEDVWSALAVATTYRERGDAGSGKGLLR